MNAYMTIGLMLLSGVIALVGWWGMVGPMIALTIAAFCFVCASWERQ